MKKYKLTGLANTLVQSEESFDVNITSPDQIYILEEYFGTIEYRDYKRGTATTFSYYSCLKNSLYTTVDPDTPRYEFEDLLEQTDIAGNWFVTTNPNEFGDRWVLVESNRNEPPLKFIPVVSSEEIFYNGRRFNTQAEAEKWTTPHMSVVWLNGTRED